MAVGLAHYAVKVVRIVAKRRLVINWRNYEKKPLLITSAFFCLLILWIQIEKWNAKFVNPPSDCVDISTFLESGIKISDVRKFMLNGNAYVLVLGVPHVSLVSLPSGPPAYIFNEHDMLVDWCRDIGDNSSFINKWGSTNLFITLRKEGDQSGSVPKIENKN